MGYRSQLFATIAALGLIQAAFAQTTERAPLSTAQVFALADEALSRGDLRTAEAAYGALATDPDGEVRTEANFRLALLLAGRGRHAEAARLLRQILDDKPGAQRVRLEMARVLDLMGDEVGARRALREAQAGGLPPDVARYVDRYSAALRNRKPFGASFEFALAPDSNINRATRSDTLGTVFGDFTVDEDAQEKSGVGAALRGQVYGRAGLTERTNVLARISGAAEVYRRNAFNDMSLGLTVGPEFQLGKDRIAVQAGPVWRTFGGELHATTGTLSFDYLRPLDRQSQLRANATVGETDNRRNPLQDGQNYSLSFSYERALSNYAGAGLTLAGDRQTLRDPGYATTSAQLTLFGYRDVGAATLMGTLGLGRLEADERLFLFPSQRVDNFYRATFGATFRQLAIGGLAPLVRVTLERNRSSVEVYEYRRMRTEFGITRAF